MSFYDALINSKNKSGDFTKLFDKLTVENDILANCTLELTPLCNFKCAFCYSRVSPEELKKLMDRFAAHFDSVHLLMDCYSTFAAKASRYKNPINDVGVTEVYGMDDPNALAGFVREHEMTPDDLINELCGMERRIFRRLYAGSVAKKMYRLYEYRR